MRDLGLVKTQIPLAPDRDPFGPCPQSGNRSRSEAFLRCGAAGRSGWAAQFCARAQSSCLNSKRSKWSLLAGHFMRTFAPVGLRFAADCRLAARADNAP